MISFKSDYDVEKGDKSDKDLEMDFKVERIDIKGLIASITILVEGVGNSINTNIELSDKELEQVKKLMYKACDLGIKRVFWRTKK